MLTLHLVHFNWLVGWFWSDISNYKHAKVCSYCICITFLNLKLHNIDSITRILTRVSAYSTWHVQIKYLVCSTFAKNNKSRVHFLMNMILWQNQTSSNQAATSNLGCLVVSPSCFILSKVGLWLLKIRSQVRLPAEH